MERFDTEQWLDRSTLRVTSLAIVASAVLVALSPTLLAGYLPTGLEQAALVVLGAWGLVLLVGVARGSSDLRLLWPLPPLVLVVQTAMLLAPTTGPVPDGQVWTMHPGVVAACIVLLVWRRWVATVFLAVFWAELALLLVPVDGAYAAIGQTLVLVPGPFIVVLLARLLVTRLLQVREAGVERDAASTRAHETEEWAHQHAHWTRVIHDKVLGALMLGSSEGSAVRRGARALATEALAEIDDASTPPADVDWLADLRTTAADLGLRARVDSVGPGAPADVAAAMRLSARQAIANVARHSGVDEVTVWVVQSPDEVTVRVVDEGNGFDPASVDPDRLGLRESVPGHLRPVGGTAEVTSRPGAGTTVLLSWRRPEPTRQLAVVLEAPDVPVRLIVGAYLGVHLVLGAAFLHVVAVPWLWGLGVAAFLLGVVLLLVGAFHRWLPVACTLVVIGATALGASVPTTRAADGRLWMCGVVMAVACVLCLRGGTRWGLVTKLGATLGLVGGWALRGGWPAAAGAGEAALQIIVFPGLCVVLAHALDRAARRVEEARTATDREHLRAGEARARVAEGERRMAQLGVEVVPLLHLLASTADLTSADRRALAQAERTTRVQLLAEGLLDRTLLTGVLAARDRGARVEVTVEQTTASPDGEGEVLTALRSVVALLLSHAGAGSELTVRWHEPRHGTHGTLALENPTRPVSPHEVAELLEAVAHEVEVEATTVFLRVLVPADAAAHRRGSVVSSGAEARARFRA